ncbi:MAG: DUF3784 domain-containing protein [Flavobacteriales bacterium]|nr:DUF3784 domain-containing protein [Flavobacteriales bacterium]MDP4953282.1 DUF3784 domain-containing protein [Flavobacteriales bacterium]
MPYLIILTLGSIFILLAFILTENNAKYILSGYNTMKPEEREKFDIKAYVRFFKRFHVVLGVSFVLLGWFSKPILPEAWHGWFIAIYPCLAYVYLAVKGQAFMKK